MSEPEYDSKQIILHRSTTQYLQAPREPGSSRLANPDSGVEDPDHLVFTGNMLVAILIVTLFTFTNNATHSTTNMESSVAHDTTLLLMSAGNLSVETDTDSIVTKMC